jgi:hypothetical protein
MLNPPTDQREERKVYLRDWMTQLTQLVKVGNHQLTSQEIAEIWERKFEVKMTEAWVKKALYGRKK